MTLVHKFTLYLAPFTKVICFHLHNSHDPIVHWFHVSFLEIQSTFCANIIQPHSKWQWEMCLEISLKICHTRCSIKYWVVGAANSWRFQYQIPLWYLIWRGHWLQLNDMIIKLCHLIVYFLYFCESLNTCTANQISLNSVPSLPWLCAIVSTQSKKYLKFGKFLLSIFWTIIWSHCCPWGNLWQRNSFYFKSSFW